MKIRELFFGPSESTRASWPGLAMQDVEASAISIYEDFIERYTLSCDRCSRDTIPIWGTHNRYLCSCGFGFGSAGHGNGLEKRREQVEELFIKAYEKRGWKRPRLCCGLSNPCHELKFMSWTRSCYSKASDNFSSLDAHTE